MGRRLVTLAVLALVAVVGTTADASNQGPGGKNGKILFASARGDNVLNQEIYSVSLAGARRNLTRNQGNDGMPVPSPDGTLLALWADRFAGDREVRALYIKRSIGDDLRALAFPDRVLSSAYASPPTWSPDGKRIAFAAHRAGELHRSTSIWVVNVDGSGLVLLAENGNGPVWAPVGTSIAFTSEYDDGIVRRARIEIVDADTGNRRLLIAPGGRPEWSPDGASIAFVHPEAGSPTTDFMLCRIPAAGGPRQELAADVTGDASWSPDGRTIVFGRYSSNAIYAVPAAGGQERRLGVGTDPAWAPDGRRIAFRLAARIYVVNPDGSGRVQVRNEDRAVIRVGPIWTRDSRALLYGSTRNYNDSDLWVVNPDGKGLKPLTRTPADERLPTWSYARDRIAFVQGEHIVVMTSAGKKPRRLARGSFPTWSRDGREIAFAGSEGIFVVPARGGRPRYIAKGSRPAWSPRRSLIAFVRGPRRSATPDCCWELRTVNPRTRTQLRLAWLECLHTEENDFVREVGQPEWSPDGRQLLVPVACDFGRAWSTYALLVKVDGSVHRFLPLQGLRQSRLAWSPDGSRIAFATFTGISSARLDAGDRRTVTVGHGGDVSLDWR